MADFQTNANIPLLAQASNPLAAVQGGFRFGQEIQQAPLQNQLLEQRVAAGQAQAAQVEQDRVLGSIAQGAQELLPMLESGDFRGANEQLKARRARIVAEGGDPADTDVAIAALESGDASQIQSLKTQAQTAIDIATSRGLIDVTAGKKGGLASAKTKIFDNGTIVKQLPDGSSEVTNPAGEVVTGKARTEAVKTAREEEVLFEGKKSKSKKTGEFDPTVTTLEADRQAKLDFQKSKSKFNDTISSTVSAIGSAKATNELMADTASEIKSFISGLNAVYGASLSSIPGSEAKRLKGLITTMKANSAFGTLIDLKASGGTLGAISASELELLAAKLGNLDQSGDIAEMERVLDQILEQNSSSIVRMETAFASEKDRFSRGFGVEAPAQQEPRQGGVLQVDANGNRAMVFPDGTFEEVQ